MFPSNLSRFALAASAGLCLSSNAFAIKGNYLNDREFPENVCRIGFFPQGENTHPQEICSGTVIAKNRVLTAGHCDVNIEHNPDVYVACGPATLISAWSTANKVKGHSRSPHYTPAGKMHDAAVFEVEGQFEHATPVQLETSLQQQADLTADLTKCRVFGFGKDNLDRLGVSHGIEFEPQSTSEAPPEAIVTGPNRAAPGDSGGPVLCPSGSSWIQVAVTISIPADSHDEVSNHELLEGQLDWLRDVEAMASLPRIGR
jgi:V8-like Glu-specific endopeptidase